MTEQEERVVIYANSNVSRGKFAAAAVHAALTAAGVHPDLPVIVLGAKPADIGMLRTVIHDAGRTEVVPGTVTAGTDWTPAGGVSPTAPDEREALRVDLEAFIAEKPTLNHYSEFTSSFKSGWLAGFRSSREATTEPRRYIAADIERLCEVMHDAYEKAAAIEGWATQKASRKPWVDVPEENRRAMRYAVSVLLEAVEASRSPKDNGGRS